MQGIKPTGAEALGIRRQLHILGRACHFPSAPKHSETSRWCGSKDDWVPSCLLAGVHTLHIWSSLLEVWEVARKGSQTLSPAGHHSITTGSGVELGSVGLGALLRAGTAGSGAAPPGRAASRKPLSPPLPRQRRRPALPVPEAPPRAA